jgi:ClpX C4-type zinc finger
MFKRKRLACSFCGKGEAAVAQLVAGPKVYICDECVVVASRIMKGEGPDQPTTHHSRRGFLEGLRTHVGAFLERGKRQRSSCQSVRRVSMDLRHICSRV